LGIPVLLDGIYVAGVGQMLITMTHSSRNRSQTKTIFDLRSWELSNNDNNDIYTFSNLSFFTAVFDHKFLKHILYPEVAERA
jgi:hypothetical protein